MTNNDNKASTHASVDEPECPRCLGLIPSNANPGAHPGAMSRADKTKEICSECGREEALERHFNPEHRCTPVSDWPIDSYRLVERVDLWEEWRRPRAGVTTPTAY